MGCGCFGKKNKGVKELKGKKGQKSAITGRAQSSILKKSQAHLGDDGDDGEGVEAGQDRRQIDHHIGKPNPKAGVYKNPPKNAKSKGGGKSSSNVKVNKKSKKKK